MPTITTKKIANKSDQGKSPIPNACGAGNPAGATDRVELSVTVTSDEGLAIFDRSTRSLPRPMTPHTGSRQVTCRADKRVYPRPYRAVSTSGARLHFRR